MNRNRICELLGIRYPILQGGMLWLADAQLAAAVSNAGALGTLSPYAGMAEGGDPVANLLSQIRQIRHLTRNPFAVNIPLDLPTSGLLLNLVLEEKAPVAVTAAGSPETYTELLHSAEITVLHVVGSVPQAVKAASCGVDAIIAEGCEAGGRIAREEIPLHILLSQLHETVSIPIIAAGGIVDGKGMAAVFDLGASGIQMGTRFIAAEECPAHTAYKEAILAGDENATVITRRASNPIRSLRCRFIETLSDMERSGAAPYEIESFIGHGRARVAQVEGDIENGDAYAGASAGKVREILPVAEVIENIIQEYESARVTPD